MNNFRKIIVTGATGFIGSALSRDFNKLGIFHTALGRDSEKLRSLYSDFCQPVYSDLSDKKKIIEISSGSETVIHLAALSTPWGKKEDFYKNNVENTTNVAEACLLNHIPRFIYISSPSIYFNYSNRHNLTEKSPTAKKPANEYVASKIAAEVKILEMGVPFIGLRPRALYGPGDTSILPRLFEINKSLGIPLVREGNVEMDITYVKNLTTLLIQLAKKDVAEIKHCLGKFYNITDGKAILFRDIVETLFQAAGVKPKYLRINTFWAEHAAILFENIHRFLPMNSEPPVTRYTMGTLCHDMTFDISKAREELNYKPVVDTYEALCQTGQFLVNENNMMVSK